MIQIERTPNPDSIKFISEKRLSEIGSEEFKKKEITDIKNTFIKELLNFSGVELVFVSENFLTVKKDKKTEWETLKPTIISHLNDYFQSNDKPILNKRRETSSKKTVEDNEIIKNIKEVLDTKIRPAVARDGGDIKFKSFKKGVVEVELRGSCSGCPSAAMTLKQGVQNLLKHYVKEVNKVEAI